MKPIDKWYCPTCKKMVDDREVTGDWYHHRCLKPVQKVAAEVFAKTMEDRIKELEDHKNTMEWVFWILAAFFVIGTIRASFF